MKDKTLTTNCFDLPHHQIPTEDSMTGGSRSNHSQDLCIEDQQTLEMRRIVRKNISKKQNMKPESLLFDNTRNVGNPILISKLVPEMISDPSYRK